jgi:hypothetical protein
MSYVQVNNLDFNDIRTSLIEYLRAQSDFTDYDFEGSTLSVLIDLLAYNTYYTAFNTNLVVNELFLDSATLRDNVVALAKQIGYQPKSKTAPKASVNFKVNFTGSAPAVIRLKKGTGFVTTFDNNLYQYVTKEDIVVPVINNEAYFTNVELYEGSFISSFFTVNNALSSQRFILENPSIDTTTIEVKVYESINSTSFEFYQLSKNILDVTPTSKVFFLEEIEDEKYELFFGDGVIGRKLDNEEYIEISYITTNGPKTNGARSFTFSGVLEDLSGNSNYPVNITNIITTSIASGGEEIEPVSKIKFNAPKYFATQDRAVTAADYAAIVRNIYPAVADIIIYGGEDASPPEYGKVKIAIKPTNAVKLSSFTKNDLVRQLKPYMVASVVPEIVDPSILYVELTSKIYYDRSKTSQTAEDIRTKVVNSINDYIKLSDTEKFNGKFRYSKLIGVIDKADTSINSNQTSVMMRKDFYPEINSTYFYEICYQNEFDVDCDEPAIQSTGFIVSEYPSNTVYLEDRAGKIVLYTLDPLSGNKVVLNDYVGDIDYKKGETKMYDLTIIKGSFFDNRIELRAKPAKNDIIATREVYLDVDISNSKFNAYQE